MHLKDTPIQLALFSAEKRCTGPCGRLLPLEAFGKAGKAKDGLNWWCRTCDGARARAYYAAHKDDLKARAIACRVVVTHKRCCECDEMLPAASFQRTTRTRDGYQTWCKACRKAYDLAHKAEKADYDAAYHVANAEHIARMGAAYRTANRERLRAAGRAYAAAHREQESQRARAWYKAHPAVVKQRAKEWNRAHPEQRQVRQHRRLARMRSAQGSFTAADIRLLYQVQNGRCAYCLADLGLTFHRDHMTALGPDGPNAIDNIALACVRCNTRKQARSTGIFFAQLLKEQRTAQSLCSSI